MGTRVVVAMSGGVDSAVTAALLQDQGHEVVGVTLKVWGHAAGAPALDTSHSCCTPEHIEDARLLAAHLGIPHYVLDVEREFEAHVVTPFCQEYAAGRTPLPCAACNTEVKFGSLLRRALAWGAESVATGHYARTIVDPATGRVLLKRGVDPEKDQTYFLYGLTQSQLRRVRFPLGTMRKAEVRALAARKGLRVANKPDSQELCFLPTGDYRDLLRDRYPEVIRPGVIRDRTGAVLGTHGGVPLYTIGQRRGLRIVPRGAESVATGHYARTIVDPATGRVLLKRGVDPEKDQTYFLYGLTQSQLRRVRFPLGTMRKAEVRALAARKGLRVANKPDSQELCFLPTGDYRDLLRDRYPEVIRPGVIRDRTGAVLGTHGGVPLYTIGQRRGLRIGGHGPYYVVALHPGRNEVVVGTEEDLFADTLVAERVNFIPFERFAGERPVLAAIRYRHPPREAAIKPMADGQVLVQFAQPLRAITPGQAVVFTDREDPDLVVGGGTIREVSRRSLPVSPP